MIKVSTAKEMETEKEAKQTVCAKPTVGLLVFVLAVTLLCGYVQYQQSKQIKLLQLQLEEVQLQMQHLEHQQNHQRQRRQVEDANNRSEDGVPIVDGSYGQAGTGTNTEGLRVYDAWFQHSNQNEIPQSRTAPRSRGLDSAIKPYHRTSASWVERGRKSNHNLNAHFDDNVYRDPYPTSSRRGSGRAIDLPNSNRAKMTPTEAPQAVSLNVVDQLPMRRYIYNTRNSTTAVPFVPRTAINNRPGRTRNQHHKKHKKPLSMARSNSQSGSLHSQFQGLKAIHYVGEVGGPRHRTPDNRVYEGEGLQLNEDGVFRQWSAARWALRMRANQNFPLDNDGKVQVKQAGVYYIYAQVNYLDEHDVNAFQVYVNDSPYLLCTVMTHTRHPTTKANTCFTGGVVFLEAQDEIYVRDLEPKRNSIIRPAHTFFGLVQLSSIEN